MAQVTLYLDEEAERLLRTSAQAAGVSNSRWVSDLIRTHAHASWPASVLALAGAFPDFPLADAAREASGGGADLPRIGF